MPGELEGKTILLVDDDKDILAAIQSVLSEMGPTIVTASDGDAALLQAEAADPDLVVLDMMLPKRSGFLIMEKLKRGKKANEKPKVIMITGNQGVRHKSYAESLGVSAYMNKPFRMEKLMAKIQSLLGDEA
ncbi:MAG: response regulator transcription factor [Planctomycetota bacterium]|jgi:DNA-binding response OmpR family regulator